MNKPPSSLLQQEHKCGKTYAHIIGRLWMLLLSIHSLVFRDRVFQRPGTHQVGKPGWPVRPSDSPFCLFSVELTTTIASFFTWVLGSNTSPQACAVNVFLTELLSYLLKLTAVSIFSR